MDRLAASGLLQKLRESREQQKQEELRQRHHQLELQAQNLVKNPGVTAQQAQPQIRVEPDQLTAFLNELQARPAPAQVSPMAQTLTQQQLLQAMPAPGVTGLAINDVLKMLTGSTAAGQLPGAQQNISLALPSSPPQMQVPLQAQATAREASANQFRLPQQKDGITLSADQFSALLSGLKADQSKGAISPGLLGFSTLVNTPPGQGQQIPTSATSLDPFAQNLLRQQGGTPSTPAQPQPQEALQGLQQELQLGSPLAGLLQGQQQSPADYGLPTIVLGSGVDQSKEARMAGGGLPQGSDIQMLLDAKMRMENTSVAAERRAQRKRARETHEQLSEPMGSVEAEDMSLEQQRAHKRMMKNRASAARSRQRKQAYVDELEDKVKALEDELVQARQEIEELKKLVKSEQ